MEVITKCQVAGLTAKNIVALQGPFSHELNLELYKKYQVNRGLRDLDGNGVLTGLTEISEIEAYIFEEGKKIGTEGKLFYRGVDVEAMVDGFVKEKRFGFEEVVYLLLFGDQPTQVLGAAGDQNCFALQAMRGRHAITPVDKQRLAA